MIRVYIDNNVWDLLLRFRDRFDLAAELPANDFEMFVPREIEIETSAIPTTKQDLKTFVEETIF